MKTLTLWQRLNTAQAVQIFLLALGVGIAWWMTSAHWSAIHRADQITDLKDRIYADVIQINSAFQELLANSRNQDELKHARDAEMDLAQRIAFLADQYPNRTELIAHAKDLRSLYGQLIEQTNTDPDAAISYYRKNRVSLLEQREQLLDTLEQETGSVTTLEMAKAQTANLVGLISVLLVLIASWLIARFQFGSVAKPLGRLVDTLERMRRGDFTQRLLLNGDDQFGELGEGLNRLADDLSALVGQVQRSGIQVNTTATEIAATAREQQSTAHEIAATTAEIGATSKEISATSKELVKTMNEVSRVAEDTTHLANNGQIAITRMEAMMRQIMEASGSITAKLAVLSEKTANINSVVTTITKVADQTNLLSLNAAIEAEKAGEYGLGFAVVAMEIRRLADQTAVATYDIEKTVKEMQAAVAAGVMGMDKFSEEVRRGVEEIRQVSTQFAQIIHQVQTLTPRFQTVNEGMHTQVTGAQQISVTLAQLSEAARQTAESLRQSNLAIEQLNEAARGLQSSVARFKLNP